MIRIDLFGVFGELYQVVPNSGFCQNIILKKTRFDSAIANIYDYVLFIAHFCKKRTKNSQPSVKQYQVIGIMSGSSLDGLDICLTAFEENNNEWSFEIKKADTIDLPPSLIDRLRKSDKISDTDLKALDISYGQWIGEQVKSFVTQEDGVIDCVAVHGHTVFHEPSQGVSLQIGCGKEIAKACGLLVVDNFRIDDIKKGGQGAPLVPVGEFYLFPEITGFVNLGGISNVSILSEKTIKAWDICPCNQVLNYFSSLLGHSYDRGGQLAKSGSFDKSWYDKLRKLDYLDKKPPKSLSNQWSQNNIIKLEHPEALEGLHTYTHLLADLIVRDIVQSAEKGITVMFTGGGAHNTYLMQLIEEKAKGTFDVIIPDKSIVEFKEALIFAFLGIMRVLERPNVFASVTGAREDTIAGHLHLP